MQVAVNGNGGRVLCFEKQLEISESSDYDGFWDDVYSKAFPNIVTHIRTKGDTKGQRDGTDRIIYLANNVVLRVGEKIRPEKFIDDDFALEYLSNDRNDSPGWIEKDLAIDFEFYGFPVTGIAYGFPWPMLRLAWIQNHLQWLNGAVFLPKIPLDKQRDHAEWLRQKYGVSLSGANSECTIIRSPNPGYFTWSLVVPKKKLLLAILGASKVSSHIKVKKNS